jgi:hypothetical protein
MVEVGEFQRMPPYCKDPSDRPIGVNTVNLTLWEVYHMAHMYGLIDAVRVAKRKTKRIKMCYANFSGRRSCMQPCSANAKSFESFRIG